MLKSLRRYDDARTLQEIRRKPHPKNDADICTDSSNIMLVYNHE